MHRMNKNRGPECRGIGRSMRGRLGGHGEGRGHGLFGGRGGSGRGDGPSGSQSGGRHNGVGHNGGGRRGKRFASEELRLMVLGLLETEPQHGYQLIRNFAEKSGDAYSPSPGVLYPLLTLLADMGLVEEAAREGSGSRRSFALNDAGKAEIDAKRESVDAAFAKLASLAGDAARIDPAPVRRAMHNLRNVMIERLRRDGTTEQTMFDAVALIDAAAQQIERLP